jgi:L-fuconolactonase
MAGVNVRRDGMGEAGPRTIPDGPRNESLPRRTFLRESVGLASGVATALAAEPVACLGADQARQPIIDTHVHFYDPTRPEGVPWPGQGDTLLYRPMLPDEWERLVEPFGSAGAIVVEASDWVEDNQWLIDLAEQYSTTLHDGMLGIVGVVGSLPLEEDASAALIERFARHRRFRGIRVNGDNLLRGLGDKGYEARLGRLADHGLTLDLNGGRVFDAADAVATQFPDLRIVLNHLGNTPITSTGPLPEWCVALERLARRANVFMKVSGLVENVPRSMKLPRASVDPTVYEPWLDTAWKAFGNERLMFGSNWPVSDCGATYADVVAITKPFVAARGPEAERWFYSGTSRAAYRWE